MSGDKRGLEVLLVKEGSLIFGIRERFGDFGFIILAVGVGRCFGLYSISCITGFGVREVLRVFADVRCR